EPISRHANFFMLGGHSLLVTKLKFSIRENFGIDVLLSRLLQTAELKRQASLIDELLVLSQNKCLASEAEEVEEMSW
ncbi:phosphopantetheine-binding protein, partial [Rheinheimera gaetbuli]